MDFESKPTLLRSILMIRKSSRLEMIERVHCRPSITIRLLWRCHGLQRHIGASDWKEGHETEGKLRSCSSISCVRTPNTEGFGLLRMSSICWSNWLVVSQSMHSTNGCRPRVWSPFGSWQYLQYVFLNTKRRDRNVHFNDTSAKIQALLRALDHSISSAFPLSCPDCLELFSICCWRWNQFRSAEGVPPKQP